MRRHPTKNNRGRPIKPAAIVGLALYSLLLGGCFVRYEPLPQPRPPRVEPVPQPAEPSTSQTPAPEDGAPPATAPAPVPPQEPNYTATTGAAASLYKQAQGFMARGEYPKAELTLERALRIEPKNGYYWYSLAKVKYKMDQPAKARQFCLKSKSLAGKDQRLLEMNTWLIGIVDGM